MPCPKEGGLHGRPLLSALDPEVLVVVRTVLFRGHGGGSIPGHSPCFWWALTVIGTTQNKVVPLVVAPKGGWH